MLRGGGERLDELLEADDLGAQLFHLRKTGRGDC